MVGIDGVIDAYFDDGIVVLARSGDADNEARISEKLKQQNVSFQRVSKSG